MALRVSLQIDGDASGAEKAATSAADALKDLSKSGGEAAKGLEDAFKAASGAAGNMVNSSVALGAANENLSSTATGVIGLIDQVTKKTLGADNAFAKLSGGVSDIAKGVAAIGPTVGTIGLLSGAFGIAVTAANTLFGIINSGSSQAVIGTQDHQRLVDRLKDAYSGAAGEAKKLFDATRGIRIVQLSGELDDLKKQQSTISKDMLADFDKQRQAYSASFYGLTGQRFTGFDAQKDAFDKLSGAFETLRAGIAGGTPDFTKFQRQLGDIGNAASGSTPEVQKAVKAYGDWADKAQSVAADSKTRQDWIDFLKGVASPETVARLLGTAKATGEAANEFDRMTKALSRQAVVREAEAASVGKSAGESEKLRAQMLLVEAAQRSGLDPAGKYAAAIDVIAGRLGNAAQKAAEMQLKSGAAFDLSQIGRTASEQSIASALRGAYGDNVDAFMNGAVASTLRFNAALGELKSTTQDLASGAWHTFLSGIQNGQNVFKSLGDAGVNALGRIAEKLGDKALDNFISGLFGSSSTGWIGKLLGGSVGGSAPYGAITLGGAAGPTPFAAANGGTFGPGWGVVGEKGPEIIKVGYGGVTVYPHEVSKPYLPGFAAGGSLSALGAVSRLGSSSHAASPSSAPQFQSNVTINVAGNADDKAIQLMRAELAKRDANFFDKFVMTYKEAQDRYYIR